jgi:hypothetical protein
MKRIRVQRSIRRTTDHHQLDKPAQCRGPGPSLPCGRPWRAVLGTRGSGGSAHAVDRPARRRSKSAASPHRPSERPFRRRDDASERPGQRPCRPPRLGRLIGLDRPAQRCFVRKLGTAQAETVINRLPHCGLSAEALLTMVVGAGPAPGWAGFRRRVNPDGDRLQLRRRRVLLSGGSTESHPSLPPELLVPDFGRRRSLHFRSARRQAVRDRRGRRVTAKG